MKKKQVVYIIAFLLLTLIMPSNVFGKEVNKEKVLCKYQYENKLGESTELSYKIYNDKVEVAFKDGTNNWYHGQDFEKIYFEQAKVNSINYVCPTIVVEESEIFTTVANNIKEEDCNGICTKLVAKEISSNKNINVKKAVDTTAISSVGIYNDNKYFIPYFRLLEDGTKEWSIDGKIFVLSNEIVTLKTSDEITIKIKLDESLINDVYKNNKLNSNVVINRGVRTSNNKTYEYLLSSKKIDKTTYNLIDGQETGSSSYKGALGDPTINLNEYNKQQNCDPESGLLGNPDDEDSVAWLLQKILNYLKLIGPFIVVVMSGIDYAKVIITSDDENMAKAHKKLAIRLILAASLFFLPDLISVLLEIFGITANPLCGLK